MLNHARHHWPRLQARAGIVEERRLLAARGLRPQPRNIPILLHRYLRLPILQQGQPLYC